MNKIQLLLLLCVSTMFLSACSSSSVNGTQTLNPTTLIKKTYFIPSDTNNGIVLTLQNVQYLVLARYKSALGQNCLMLNNDGITSIVCESSPGVWYFLKNISNQIGK